MEEKHCKWYDDEFCTNAKSPCVADFCPVVEYPELCKHREFDKDINVRSKDDTDIVVGMTDEEIVKALDCGCLAVVFGEHCEKCVLHDIESCNIVPDAIIALIHRLQSENERLTEENKRLSVKVWNYEKPAVQPVNYAGMVQRSIADCYRENAELQKQVDELTERYLEESKERLEFEQLYKKIQHAHSIGLGAQRSQ